MKTFVFALTALTLATGGAFAASNGQTNERPGTSAPVEAARTVQVPAGDVMTSAELSRAGMDADELVTITQINTTQETASIRQHDRR